MDDLKSVTLSHLRDLARKHLGPGYSKLTKRELIAVLARFVPGLKKLARLAGIELPPGPKPAAKPPQSPRGKEARAVARKKAAGRKKAAPKAEEAAQPPKSAQPAQVVSFPPRPRQARSAAEAWQEDTAELVVGAPELEEVFQQAAEPLVEGFFVARVMGERELRHHHLTEDQAPLPVAAGAGYEERLGELPLDYGDDLALALARDPHTLFLTWDFGAATLSRAREGLGSPRAVLRVFDEDRLVREEEIALESRSFYIHGLPPGRPYRVEAHLVGQEGRSRRIGHSTQPLTLPRTGPSPDTSVRFMQVPPPPRTPAQGGSSAEGGGSGTPGGKPPPEEPVEYAEEYEYIEWRRIPLPGSGELQERAESKRARTTRQEREGVGRREYLEISARPPGSSEQTAGGGGPARGGASEQTHWTPPPSGRGQ